ncbi:MAG: hypothetical protein BroJett018_37420 [Chloroflexota bacterium]|nr:hypothetical protein [Chloroflexota bacterium]NOG64212.1 hypothetical protein [Chloroflexota bacterium]GIK65948.1 MAG: hypothetical protein BroJett018_37420 [Chloroflexota bacterium]
MTTSITARYPQRIAWATLLAAFVTFCLLMAGIAWAINWVVFDSTIDLRTTVKVSRGTIGYTAPNDTERVVRDRYPVQTGDTVRTDELSQGYITIDDPLNDDQVLATIQMFGGSSVILERASRPRFGLGDNPYSVLLTDAFGKFDVTVSSRLEREFRLEIRGNNYSVRLDHEGYYTLQFGVDGVNVTVQRGQAVVIDKDNEAKLIEATEPIEKWAFRKNEAPKVISILINLLDNPYFLQGAPEGDDVLDVWGCQEDRSGETRSNDSAITDPRGLHERVFFQDRFTLHFKRTGSEPVYPHYSGCKQTASTFAATAPDRSNIIVFEIVNPVTKNINYMYYIDTSQYERLYVRASVYIASQSLSGCGAEGTECAIMLKMPFKNAGNVQANTESAWIQGFYTYYDEGVGQVQCLGCQNHEHINGNSWYTFESSDFMLATEELRPVMIREIEVYASGHLYNSYISELSIIAEVPVVSAQSVEP